MVQPRRLAGPIHRTLDLVPWRQHPAGELLREGSPAASQTRRILQNAWIPAPFEAFQPARLGTLRCPCLEEWTGQCGSLQTWHRHILHRYPPRVPGNSHRDSHPILGSLQMRLVVFWFVCWVLPLIRSRGTQPRLFLFGGCCRRLLVARSFMMQLCLFSSGGGPGGETLIKTPFFNCQKKQKTKPVNVNGQLQGEMRCAGSYQDISFL